MHGDLTIEITSRILLVNQLICSIGTVPLEQPHIVDRHRFNGQILSPSFERERDFGGRVMTGTLGLTHELLIRASSLHKERIILVKWHKLHRKGNASPITS